jgi:alkanesulfonate monooxygenase SsuD/methylene tetrahydromethanopterin reductase-like flavin-dependent oxidoreductase (luciferase family)
VLGVGAGWDTAEHEAYGIPFPGTGERMDRLDEALAVCRALFHDQRATVTGGSPADPGRIPAIGEVLTEVFPG